jgi:hypothetical protein
MIDDGRADDETATSMRWVGSSRLKFEPTMLRCVVNALHT